MKTAIKKACRTFRRYCISNPKALWKRYVLGFAFIFVTISFSHWASLETITAAKDDAQVVSVSNRQRMLSQRILFLMSEMERNEDPLVTKRLEAALNLFESSHDWLISRPDLPPRLHALYFEKQPISLDAFSRRFVQMVGIASYAEGPQKEELQKVLAQWGKEDLIASLATAADLFRQDSEKRIANLQYIQQATLIAALFVLLAEALLIFLPAQVSVNVAIRKQERRERQLRASLKVLKNRNAELVTARHSLLRAANHDALTGLHNRRAVYEHLTTDAIVVQGGDVTRCIMKIDLDLFKQVNDSLGHDAGDRVLEHVADILTQHSRRQDCIGRIGGDEFVVVLDNPTSMKQLQDFAQRIILQISDPMTVAGTQIKIGASIGFTIATTSNATPDQMLIEADLALYEAKRAGRGLAFAYSDALAADIETRRLLFNEITAGLNEDQFEPYLQPQVFTETGELYGCEVLARWRHPERGIIPPATFIAAAEEAGLIDRIDHIMIQKGLDVLEQLRADGVDIPGISINASPPTLRDPQLTERLRQAVQERLLSPVDLTVEVLESTLIENDDDVALRTIQSLSEAGFPVVLDDFGTGYASMSNLSRLHLNGIKLDQSLIKPIPDPRAESIIEALVTLSRNLNMRVVAEGVETPQHFQTARSLGCDVVQGYGISRPFAADTFHDWYDAYRGKSTSYAKGGA
ncbi:MAG: putative bifunctional diguanylate cyclase/phosphodiesterase [Roseobacter sp.]